MELRLKNANIYKNGSFIKKDFPLDSFISAGSFTGSFSDFDNIYVFMIHNSRTAIEDKVKEIKDCLICYINTNKSKSYEDGLMGNNIGILLFLYHYSRFFNDEGIEDIAHSWAMYIVNNVHKVESYAYCDGWSGILMCFKYLKQ